MYRILNSVLGSTLIVAALCSTATAQTAPATAPIPPPTSGLLVSYQYWPTQYIQWIVGNDLPYSMIEFDVDTTTKTPLYHCVLTGNDGTRTHYSNIDPIVAAYKAQGEPSYKAAIAFDTDDTGKPGSTSTVRFTMQDGKALEWRFVQGSDISAQGSGLTPLPKAPIPVFAYREEGAVAGEGTALKIGDAVNTAEVWKEISHPPYFVAYRGAVTSSAHMLVLVKGSETWKITQAPTALAAGSTWELDRDNGDHRTLTVDKTDGIHATVIAIDKFHPVTRTTLDVTRTATGWTTDRIRYAPVKDGDKHFVTVAFTAATATMEITAGKKAKVATASVETGTDAADHTAALKFTAPAWATDKQINEHTVITADTLTLSAN